MKKYIVFFLIVLLAFLLLCSHVLAADGEIIDYTQIIKPEIAGQLTISDVQNTLKAMVSGSRANNQAWRFDVDGDGFLRINDMLLLMQGLPNG